MLTIPNNGREKNNKKIRKNLAVMLLNRKDYEQAELEQEMIKVGATPTEATEVVTELLAENRVANKR